MMMKYITKSLKLSAVVSLQIKTNDPLQLENIKNRLKDRLGIPAGWHMSGIPLLASMILATLSFALPQPFLWLTIFDWLGGPQYAVMAAVVPVSLVYSLVMVLAMFFVARGSFPGLKLFLAMVLFSGLLAIIYFITACVPSLFGVEQKTWFILSSILGMILVASCVGCINSAVFYRSNALYLHNRVWRKQLSIQQKKTHDAISSRPS